MEFVMNRTVLSEMCKQARRLANDNSPIEALRGLYLEADEAEHTISVIATNYEASIFLKQHANVLRGSKIVLNAALLDGILEKLDGANVEFAQDTKNKQMIHISSGKSRFSIYCLPGSHYPKPLMPFPEDTVKISNIKALAAKVCFAVSKDENKPALQCVCLNVGEKAANAVATNTQCIMMAKSSATSKTAKQILIPAASLQILAAISSEDSVYSMGQVGNETAFMCRGMLFSIKTPRDKFALDMKKIISSVNPEYTATVDSGELKNALEVCSIQNETGQVQMKFLSHAIRFQCAGEIIEGKYEMPADVEHKTPAAGFLYNVNHFKEAMKRVTGKVKIELDQSGMMFIKSKEAVYFQSAQMLKKPKTVKAA